MGCKLMDRLMDIDGVSDLSSESIEQIKRIICGTHNGVCSERYSGIKGHDADTRSAVNTSNTKGTCGKCTYWHTYSRVCAKTSRCRGYHSICNCEQFKSSTPNWDSIEELDK